MVREMKEATGVKTTLKSLPWTRGGYRVMVMDAGRLGEETVRGEGKGTVTAFAPESQSFGNLLSLRPYRTSRRGVENVVPELRTEEQAGDACGA